MSKTIIIIRHAKSSWTDLSMRDFDRPLDDRGLKDAPMMASKLKDFGVKPDVLISSAANRALMTANFFSGEFGLAVKEEKSLYHAPPSAYLEKINGLSEDITTVVFFGHNPGVTDLANEIEPGIIDDLPTCSITIAEVKRDLRWEDIDWRHMTLETILTPKQKNY
jgi:phosphohistidine phosphatase